MARQWHTHCGPPAVRSFLSTILFVVLWEIAVPAQACASDELPFRMRDGFLWVEVSMARVDRPLNFILDTGAQVSVIDQRVARGIGLRRGVRVSVTGVQTTVTGFWPQRVNADVAGVALPRRFLALDLTALSRVCGTPVDGLLGADFFRRKVVQIDFRRQRIRFLTPEQQQNLQGESLALDIRSCGMRVPVNINGGKPQWMRLDTGCAAPLHWVTRSVNSNLCRRQLTVGLTELSLPTTTVNVGLGSEMFEDISAVIHEREIFAGEAGLLGTGLLSQFAQVTVDAKNKRLILAR